MGAADGHTKENQPYNYLCSWLSVSKLVFACMFGGADHHVHSVCIVTIIRLALSIQINLDDFTYDVTRISIVTQLEPLLGIIIACLPTFPPAVKKLTGHIKTTNPKTRNVLSNSVARLRLRRAKDSTFKQFDDSVLLTDLENNRAFDHVVGPSDRSDYSVKGNMPLGGFESPQQSPIIFEKDLDVQSEKGRSLEAGL